MKRILTICGCIAVVTLLVVTREVRIAHESEKTAQNMISFMHAVPWYFEYPPDSSFVAAMSSVSYQALREDLAESLRVYPRKFALTLMMAEEGQRTYSYRVRTIADLPRHNVEAPCPRGQNPKMKCWFIYYQDEGMK